VHQQNAHGVTMSSGGRRRGQVADRGRRDGQRWRAVQRQRSAEQLVLVRPGGAECSGRLGVNAVGGERVKRPAGRLPARIAPSSAILASWAMSARSQRQGAGDGRCGQPAARSGAAAPPGRGGRRVARRGAVRVRGTRRRGLEQGR
jgi:hypothetical protein